MVTRKKECQISHPFKFPPPVHPFNQPAFQLFICLSIHASISSTLYPFLLPFLHPSFASSLVFIHPSQPLTNSLSLHPSICPSLPPCVPPPSLSPPLFPFLHLVMHPSINLSFPPFHPPSFPLSIPLSRTLPSTLHPSFLPPIPPNPPPVSTDPSKCSSFLPLSNCTSLSVFTSVSLPKSDNWDHSKASKVQGLNKRSQGLQVFKVSPAPCGNFVPVVKFMFMYTGNKLNDGHSPEAGIFLGNKLKCQLYVGSMKML